MKYILALDQGTTSSRAIVFDRTGRSLAMSQRELAAGIGVGVALILALKSRLHAFTREVLTAQELHDGLLLIAAALIVLPLLPDRTVDAWHVFNPHQLWRLVVLVMAIIAGLACTLIGATPVGAEHDYRQTVAPWFRSIWILQPRGDLMTLAPAWFQIHVMIALVLFCLWPFTRLVHVFSAPVGYLVRPYIVYRSKGDTGQRPTPSRAPQGTWTSPTARK